METVDAIVERLRQEPHHVLGFRRSNCIAKSFRLKRECRRIGIDTKAVICIGLIRRKPLGFWMKIPMFHGWAELDGKRIELGHPPGTPGRRLSEEFESVIAIWL